MSDDYASQLADFLEAQATKVRQMTVDRVADAVTWTAVGLVLAVIAITAALWIVVGLFRALGELVGMEVAYAIVGGISVVAGAFVWSRRFPKTDEERR